MSADRRAIARHQRGESAAVGESYNEYAAGVHEVEFRHGIESSLPARNLAVEIGLGTVALAFSNAGLIHADRGVPRLVNQTA